MTRQFEVEALQRLVTSEAVFKKFQAIQSESLLLRYRPSVKESRLKAVAMLDDPGTVRAYFGEEINAPDVSADIILFSSRKLPRPERISVDQTINLDEFQSQSESSIRQAFNERTANNAIVLAGNRLFNIVSVPIEVSGHIDAVVTYANEIGDDSAQDVSQLTGSEIVFLANNSVIASTLRTAEQRKTFEENLSDFSSNQSNGG